MTDTASTAEADAAAAAAAEAAAADAAAKAAAAPQPRKRAAKPEAEAAGNADEECWARLARGDNYAVRYGDRMYRFKKGVEQRIPTGLRDRLATVAVDPVSVQSGDETTETEMRSKFVFRELGSRT